MPASSPTVTIAIPVYNCALYIERAISSALAQSWTDFELLILDNASTDDTAQVISQFSDNRIRVIQQTRNIGAMGNWNAALQLAQGQFFKLLCADDMLYPECVEHQLAILTNPDYTDISLVASQRDIISPTGKRLMTRGLSGRNRVMSGIQAIKQSVRAGTNILGEPFCVMFRTNLISLLGVFDGSIPYLIDFDYWCRILLHGKLYVLTEPAGSFTISSGSWSVEISRLQSSQFCAFIDKIALNPTIGLSTYDILRGKMMAQYNARLRRLVYMRYTRGN